MEKKRIGKVTKFHKKIGSTEAAGSGSSIFRPYDFLC